MENETAEAKNGGCEWYPKGQPERVQVHDFINPELGKATPSGVYGIGRDEGWVSVGIDHDTAQFEVSSITKWWKAMGSKVYPTGLDVTVAHFPPGTSKWNKIEHRLFSHISMNWIGRPLLSHQTVVILRSAWRTSAAPGSGTCRNENALGTEGARQTRPSAIRTWHQRHRL